VRFNSLALGPSISASTTNSSPAFLTEPFADSFARACRRLHPSRLKNTHLPRHHCNLPSVRRGSKVASVTLVQLLWRMIKRCSMPSRRTRERWKCIARLMGGSPAKGTRLSAKQSTFGVIGAPLERSVEVERLLAKAAASR